MWSFRFLKSSAVFSGIPAYARITMFGSFMSTTISPGSPGGSGRSVPGCTTLTSNPGLASPHDPGFSTPGGT